MAVLLAFAFVSGVITILSPCILPVLPIVLAGGSTGGRARPFGVIAGFVASFSFFTLALSAIVQALGIPADTMRYAAIVLIVLFGIVMLVPRLREVFDVAVSRIASRGGAPASRKRAGGSAAPARSSPAFLRFRKGGSSPRQRRRFVAGSLRTAAANHLSWPPNRIMTSTSTARRRPPCLDQVERPA